MFDPSAHGANCGRLSRYLSKEKLTTEQEIAAALYRALVEVFTLQAAKESVMQASKFQKAQKKTGPSMYRSGLLQTDLALSSHFQTPM